MLSTGTSDLDCGDSAPQRRDAMARLAIASMLMLGLGKVSPSTSAHTCEPDGARDMFSRPTSIDIPRNKAKGMIRCARPIQQIVRG